MRKSSFLLLTFSLTFGLLADVMEWEAVQGAVSYQFQVVDADNRLVQEKKEIKALSVELQIGKTGKYKYRIGVVDKLGRVVFGDWVDFEIDENSTNKNCR